jgi:hypothetical protein
MFLGLGTSFCLTEKRYERGISRKLAQRVSQRRRRFTPLTASHFLSSGPQYAVFSFMPVPPFDSSSRLIAQLLDLGFAGVNCIERCHLTKRVVIRLLRYEAPYRSDLAKHAPLALLRFYLGAARVCHPLSLDIAWVASQNSLCFLVCREKLVLVKQTFRFAE